MEPRRPTAQQLSVLRWIRDEAKRSGIAPSVRELMAEFGWSSTNAAIYHLRALEALGLLEREPKGPRTVRITPTGKQALLRRRRAQ